MPQSLAHLLAHHVPSVPDTLIGNEWLVRILDFSHLLPGEWGWGSQTGFECPLGEVVPRGDFGFAIQEGPGRDLLAGLDPHWDFSGELSGDPVWERLRAFARRWADPGSLLSPQKAVWLEFDLHDPHSRHLVPSIFFGLQQTSRDGSTCDGMSVLVARLELLQGRPLPAPVVQLLQRVLATLPAGAGVYLVGAMIARPTAAVRVCIAGLKSEQVLEYLAALGWPGSRDELTALLKTCSDLFAGDSLRLVHLDLDARLQPIVGLEMYLSKEWRSRARFHWGRILEQLVALGWCTHDKRTGLLQWLGGVELSPDPAIPSSAPLLRLWPDDSERPQILGRRINHLKFVHQPGLPVQVKAYVFLLTISRTPNAFPMHSG